MNLLKRVVEFYVFGNLHVALATTCLTLISLHNFGIEDWVLPLFVFFSTLLSYNFIRLFRSVELESWFHKWVADNKVALMVVSLISLLALLFLFFRIAVNSIVVLVPIGLLTFLYSVPLLGLPALRSLPGFKLVLIASTWAFVTVVLPLVNYGLVPSSDFYIIFMQRMLFVAAITLPFDLRDLSFDKAHLNTVPQRYGVRKTKQLGLVLLMVFLMLNFFKHDPSKYLSLEFTIALVSLILIVRSSKNQNKYFSAFYVEAIPILWYLLVYLKYHL